MPEIEVTSLLLGTGLGLLIAWLATRLYLDSRRVRRREVEAQYVRREVHEKLQEQADLYREDMMEKEQELRELGRRLAGREEAARNLERRLEEQGEETKKLRQQFQTEFENVANRLLEEKSEKFVKQNQQQLSGLLDPLREKIREFEEGVQQRFLLESKDRFSLRQEIGQLRELNTQLSQDAVSLSNALRGDSKVQGDWGEMRLELILERAGLLRDVHYRTQVSFRDENGRQKRPDFIIHLPEDKHLIIDCKVSLTAYERYFQSEEEEEQQKYLKEHLLSLRNHIRDLNGKNYQHLHQLQSPDYLLLYVPLEPAFALAVQHDPQLFLDALDQNIVLVTSSTLLATMRTVSFIWKQEKQKQSVLEIARQSGLLYDKFCGFVDDLEIIGRRLEQAEESYRGAMNKLKFSKKYGDTLIGRAEKIRELGAKASKELPRDMVEAARELGEEE